MENRINYIENGDNSINRQAYENWKKLWQIKKTAITT